jgi:YggT family protein
VAPFRAQVLRCQGWYVEALAGFPRACTSPDGARKGAEITFRSLVPAASTRYMSASAPFWTIRPMRAILDVILLILQIYVWLLIAAAILSWLVAFNVVNTRNQFVASIGEFLFRITEPALRPIRSIMPNLGGIDISPVILILIIFFIQNVIVRYIYPNVF